MEKIRIVIADNHPVFREGLGRLLDEEDDLQVVGRAADVDELLALSSILRPDVVIIDVTMPRLGGIKAIKQIKDSSPRTEVLGLSSFSYPSYILASLQAGAAGYLTKDTAVKELVCAIRLAYAGEGFINRDEANRILRDLISVKTIKNGRLELFPREVAVLKMAARGMRNKEIAKELLISERTVQAHLRNIFGKLDVNSRTEAILRALRHGWLEINDLT
jgi:DNA-binding NarL/FixJ family response regulator